MADVRAVRIAAIEARFRDINERLQEDLRRLGDAPEPVEFVCECGRPECADIVRLTHQEYDAVRADPRRFALLPGHEQPAVEHLVEEHDRYAVVEKVGEPARIAVETDPRRHGPQ